jgi:hypothetical protein
LTGHRLPLLLLCFLRFGFVRRVGRYLLRFGFVCIFGPNQTRKAVVGSLLFFSITHESHSADAARGAKVRLTHTHTHTHTFTKKSNSELEIAKHCPRGARPVAAAGKKGALGRGVGNNKGAAWAGRVVGPSSIELLERFLPCGVNLTWLERATISYSEILFG